MKKIRISGTWYKFDTVDQLPKIDWLHIGNDVDIGDKCIIDSTHVRTSVSIGNSVRLKAGVEIQSGVVIGNGCTIDKSVKLEACVNIGHNVYVWPKSQIGYNTRIETNASIGTGALIGTCTRIGNAAVIENNVTTAMHVVIGGNARILRGEIIKHSPLYIYGGKYPYVFNAYNDIIQIGCTTHKCDKWLKNHMRIARSHEINDPVLIQRYVDLITMYVSEYNRGR